MTDTEMRHPLGTALLLTLCVWSLLLASQLASGFLGGERGVLLGFALATVLVASTRESVGTLGSPWDASLGLGAGYCSFSAWVLLVSWVGLGIGLEVRAATGRPSLAIVLASLGFAPVFEELLYRERLLPALRERFGAPLAVALSSLLFALPHVESWSLLGTFLVGLALGPVYLSSGSVGLCIGLHAGLNLAALVCGSGGEPCPVLPLGPGLLLAMGLLFAAFARSPRGGTSSRPRPSTSGAARRRGGR
jgi:membrane protease YdiL (CAAX protease family)